MKRTGDEQAKKDNLTVEEVSINFNFDDLDFSFDDFEIDLKRKRKPTEQFAYA